MLRRRLTWSRGARLLGWILWRVKDLQQQLLVVTARLTANSIAKLLAIDPLVRRLHFGKQRLVAHKSRAETCLVGAKALHRALKQLGNGWVRVELQPNVKVEAPLRVSAKLLVDRLCNIVAVLGHVDSVHHLEKIWRALDEDADEHLFVRAEPALPGFVERHRFFLGLGRVVHLRVVRLLRCLLTFQQAAV